jgi:hypothetical protein
MSWTRGVRLAIGLVGLVAFLGGLATLAVGDPGFGLWALLTGGVLLLAAVLEVGRYRARRDPPAEPAGLQPTDEVFIDPTSGARTRVWFDPRTGERSYQPER